MFTVGGTWIFLDSISATHSLLWPASVSQASVFFPSTAFKLVCSIISNLTVNQSDPGVSPPSRDTLLKLFSHSSGWNVRTAPWSRTRHTPSRSTSDPPRSRQESGFRCWGWLGFQDRALWPPPLFFFIPRPSASRPVIVGRFYLQCSSGPPRPSFVPPLTIPYMQSGGNGPSVVELWGGWAVSVKKLLGKTHLQMPAE